MKGVLAEHKSVLGTSVEVRTNVVSRDMTVIESSKTGGLAASVRELLFLSSDLLNNHEYSTVRLVLMNSVS